MLGALQSGVPNLAPQTQKETVAGSFERTPCEPIPRVIVRSPYNNPMY